MKIRIATWNVAAGRKMNSLATFDYAAEEDIDYFRKKLGSLNLDIICLQESQFSDHDSFPKRLADLLGFPYIAETPGWPSHVDKGYQMTPAIISRLPFVSTNTFLPPRPGFRLIHKGKELPPLDRYFLEIKMDGFNVVTAHPEPLRIFDLSYESGKGLEYGLQIDQMAARTFTAPIIFAADFNFADIAFVLPETTSRLGLVDALPEVDTTPIGKRQDHICFSPEFKVLDRGIVKTETDHYLCWAELEIQV